MRREQRGKKVAEEVEKHAHKPRSVLSGLCQHINILRGHSLVGKAGALAFTKGESQMAPYALQVVH
jgi:hypothetical protein